MARQVIDIGVQGNDGTGDSIRESFRKVNDNFQQLFAVFGQGGSISFTDLDDAPSTYGANEIVITNADGDALLTKELIQGENIFINNDDPSQIVISSVGGKLSLDESPMLAANLNAQGLSIGNIATPTSNLAQEFNSKYGTSLTEADFVISKGYADNNYAQLSGSTGVGSQFRIRSEPVDASEYTLLIDDWTFETGNLENSGYAIFLQPHGFISGTNGKKFTYAVTGTPASGLVPGVDYYLRYFDNVRLSVHATRLDAEQGTNRIIVNYESPVADAARGDESFIDTEYKTVDDNGYILDGYWLSNEAVPRESVVRRQGDHMAGALYLHDHPGDFAGVGSPNGEDDLQAATKYYVDSSSFTSAVNLFVAVAGNDDQSTIPLEKQGRAFSYAFKSVGRACARAEDLIKESLSEPGPYRQLLTYGNYNNFATLTSSTGTPGVATRTLNIDTDGQGVDQSKNPNNKDLREGSIIKGIRSGATGKVVSYDFGNDATYSIELLHTISDITLFQTDYRDAANKLTQNRTFIQDEIIAYLDAKYDSLDYDSDKCFRDVGLIIDALVHDIKFGGNVESIRAGKSYLQGQVFPQDQLAPTLDAITSIYTFAQNVISNTAITAPSTPIGPTASFGKRTTGVQNVTVPAGETNAIAIVDRLIKSILNIIQYGERGNGTYLEFLDGETLEYGQPVPELQISIKVESGIYYEQLPIRVPANVSIDGDEFRRTIIRPAPGVSTSPWASLYFYRDDSFDGLTRTYISAADAVSTFVPAVPGTAAYYNVTTTSTQGLEAGMYLYVTSGTGIFAPVTRVARIISSTEFEIDKAPSVALSGATVRGLNGSGLAPTGNNFGYHYLTDPTGVSGIFNSTIAKTGNHTAAANVINTNRTTLVNQVISYINTTYPDFEYDQTTCARDVGYILDAISYDIGNSAGGVTRTLVAGHAYRRNSSSLIAITEQLTETLDAITYLGTRLATLLTGDVTAPIVADLINGIKNIITGVNNPPKENKDMDVFLLNDATIIRNLSVQGHGGFMCVLDPEGQIQTKSPYFQTCTSLSNSINKQRFAGGMLIDGFSGNLRANITARTNSTTITVSGLIRKPLVPNSFYVAGSRYQLNEVTNYNSNTGTATLILDESTPWPVSDPTTDPLVAWTYPYSVIIETAGNRSMLANDFTQVNDLSYGVVAANNGISELVSVFTYYNWSSYYSKNGGQIRSLNGSSCHGQWGMKAEGRDPNEIPDEVFLADNTLQTAKVYKRDSFTGKNLAGEASLYIDNYQFAPYNISEIEIDHTNSKSSLVPNTNTLSQNIVILATGINYQIGDYLEDVPALSGSEVYAGGNPTKIQVTAINGSGGITAFNIVDLGTYSINPIGGYPQTRGTLVLSGGSGTGAQFTASYLGDVSRYEVTNIEKTVDTGFGVDPGGVTTLTAGTFIPGKKYKIVFLGNTDWNVAAGTVGLTYNVGSGFVAATAGTGTGTVVVGRTVLKINLGSELSAPLADGQIVDIRSLQNFKFNNIQEIKPTRPSTALEFVETGESGVIYRTTAYGLTAPTGESLQTNQIISSVQRSSIGGTLVATITLTSNHSLAAGDKITVNCDSPYDSFNVLNATIISTPSLNSVTYANVGPLVPLTSLTGLTNTVVYGNQAVLTFDNSFNYINARVNPLDIATADPAGGGKTFGSKPGDNKIAVEAFSTENPTIANKLNQGDMIFTWAGRLHRVVSYTPAAGSLPPYITIADKPYGEGSIVPSGTGLIVGFSEQQTTQLRIGLQANEKAEITVNISTCRATGHDFLDVGSGGYNDTNYPSNLLGSPAKTPSAAQEVQEISQGRVFYVSTDQDGVFKVGKFFAVDQGTGSVTFSASIALSNLDGIGFKRGTVVKEFSTDTTMTDNADDSVPTESAVRGYIDKRLGITHSGGVLGDADIIPTGPPIYGGFLPTGITVPMKVDLNLNGNSIINVASPVDDSDATNKLYVDNLVAAYDELSELTDVTLTGEANHDLLVYNGTDWVNAETSTTGEVLATLSGNALNLTVKSGVIDNDNVMSSAGIVQSKLSMALSTDTASAPTGTSAEKQALSGLSSFDSSNFTVTDGWVSVKASGIALTDIQNIGANTLLGNSTGAAAAPQEIQFEDITTSAINTLFTTYEAGSSLMARRANSLKTTSTFSTISGLAVAGTATITNVPVVNISGAGNGALVTVVRQGGSYDSITVTYGGNGYAEGDQLKIFGSFVGGIDGTNDLTFTVASTGTNIDTASYLVLSKVSALADANSIVKTDANKNLGTAATKFNNVFATTVYSDLVGNVTGNITGTVQTAAQANITSVGTLTNLNVGGYVSIGGLLNVSVVTGITSAGTNQATATPLTANINVIETVTSNTGVRLPNSVAGYRIIVRNSSLTTLNLYPPVGGTINGGGSFELVSDTTLEFIAINATTWYTMNATFA
jgi:hypothetical protein